jgi:hypothetical protein
MNDLQFHLYAPKTGSFECIGTFDEASLTGPVAVLADTYRVYRYGRCSFRLSRLLDNDNCMDNVPFVLATLATGASVVTIAMHCRSCTHIGKINGCCSSIQRMLLIRAPSAVMAETDLVIASCAASDLRGMMSSLDPVVFA